jgi:hypothetical protein
LWQWCFLRLAEELADLPMAVGPDAASVAR